MSIGAHLMSLIQEFFERIFRGGGRHDVAYSNGFSHFWGHSNKSRTGCPTYFGRVTLLLRGHISNSMQQPASGHDGAESAVTLREIRRKVDDFLKIKKYRF